MQPPEESFEKSVALPVPFVQRSEKERRVPVCEPDAPLITRRRQRRSRGKVLCDGVEQALDKRTELRARRGPIAAGVRRNPLVQMSFRNGKAVTVEQQVHFIVGGRKSSTCGSARRNSPPSTVKPSRSKPRFSAS